VRAITTVSIKHAWILQDSQRRRATIPVRISWFARNSVARGRFPWADDFEHQGLAEFGYGAHSRSKGRRPARLSGAAGLDARKAALRKRRNRGKRRGGLFIKKTIAKVIVTFGDSRLT